MKLFRGLSAAKVVQSLLIVFVFEQKNLQRKKKNKSENYQITKINFPICDFLLRKWNMPWTFFCSERINLCPLS